MKLAKNFIFSLVIVLLSTKVMAMQQQRTTQKVSSLEPLQEAPEEPAKEDSTRELPQMVHWSKASFPAHWGAVPDIQTQDVRPLPKPYEKYYGSSTLFGWIEENLKKDADNGKEQGSDKVQCGVYPEHWGTPPLARTKDLRTLPAPWDHCRDSGTIVRWIKKKQEEDKG